MTDVFDFHAGSIPVLVSIPHDGRELAPGQTERMTDLAKTLPDTDWHVRRLYEFAADKGASVLAARYSRYVIDLNRPADDSALYPDQVSTGLCPVETFGGSPLYVEGGVDRAAIVKRIDTYWQPYHAMIRTELDRLVEAHGHAVLWDAHSIASRVSRLFDGELPALNIGTNNGASCDGEVESAVWQSANSSEYKAVLNDRFRGGYITRQYGDPRRGVHAIQLELAQKHYMNENDFSWDARQAAKLAPVLRAMIDSALGAAAKI